MGGLSSPLDTLIAAESELAETRTRLANAQHTILFLRKMKIDDVAQSAVNTDLHEAYRIARRTLEEEQEKHRLAHQRDPFAKMPASMHEAIKQVRLLAVEIADEAAGYRA